MKRIAAQLLVVCFAVVLIIILSPLPEPAQFILFLGDTSFAESHQERLAKQGGENILSTKGYDYSFFYYNRLLENSWYAVANLESPLTSLRDSPYYGKKEFIHYETAEYSLSALSSRNIRVVSLANNHMMDFGEEGLFETVENLNQYAFAYIGAGKNLSDVREYYYDEIRLKEKIFPIAIISGFQKHPRYEKEFSFYANNTAGGVLALEPETIKKIVERIKEQNPDTFIILFPHWGSDYTWRSEEQERLAQSFVDSGVDLIMGHGSHWFQEVALINNTWVVYSLGNFVFNTPGGYTDDHHYSLISAVFFNDSSISELRLYPILTDNKITRYRGRPVRYDEFLFTRELLERTSQRSFEIGQDDFGYYFRLPM